LTNCGLDADDYVSIGEYPNNNLAFNNAANTTFDSIAIYPGSRLTVYSGKNFAGSIVLDVVGPALIWNGLYRASKPDGIRTVYQDMTREWDSGLNDTFPPSKRFAMDPTKGHDMWAWAKGSCKIISEDIDSETQLIVPSPASLSFRESELFSENIENTLSVPPVYNINFEKMDVGTIITDFTVDCAGNWQDTGVDILPGCTITITANGTVFWALPSLLTANPDGVDRDTDPVGLRCFNYVGVSPMPSECHMKLIGAVLPVGSNGDVSLPGGTPLFAVGSSYAGNPGIGRLYLRQNDYINTDNSGYYYSTITTSSNSAILTRSYYYY
jgi:hypothetical protein